MSSEKKQVEVKILDARLGKEFPLPQYMTGGAAAIDMVACIDEPLTLQPGHRKKIPTGMAIHINDQNVAAILAARSGLSSKHGICLSNGIGLIDSDYQGQIEMAAFNSSELAYTIQPGERVYQMLFVPIVKVDFSVVDEFSAPTERGEGGFGHTGK